MKGTTVLRGVLILLAAVFLIHQAFSAFYKPISTESVLFYTMSDGVRFTGLIVRNEIPVSGGEGILHFVTEDGSHVAKDGVIANLYDSENASVTLTKIEELNKKISELEELMSYNDLEAADLDLVNTRVNEALDKMIVSGSAGNYSGFSACSETLLSALNKRQAAMGDTASFSEQLEHLKQERDSLAAALPGAKGTVRAVQSGYFISKTDGYEAVLNCNDPAQLTPEFLEGIKPQALPENTVGKIVSDYEWYIAARVPISESVNFKEGDTLVLTTSVKSHPRLSVTVRKINVSEDASQAVILFATSEMNGDLAAMRSGSMTAIKKEYSGLRVPANALRFSGSVKGVYVLSGLQAKFVPINILYSNDTYMICEQQSTDENSLRLYDEVIVKGKKLYDGKVVA